MSETEGKPVAVVDVDRRVHDVLVIPGVTPADVLAQCGVAGNCVLTNADGHSFAPDEALFGLVQAGDKLLAAPATVVAVSQGGRR